MTKPNRNWSATRPIVNGMLMLVLLVGGFGTWSLMSQIAGAIVTSGQIEVEQNRQIVQHPDGGVVESISVAEGDTVQAGDLLLRLDGAMMRSEYAIVEGQLFEISARRGRLEAELSDADEVVFSDELVAIAKTRPDVAELMDGQLRLFESRRNTLAQQVDQMSKRRGQIASQIEGVDAQSAALETQLELIQQELDDQQSLLDRGLAQASRVLALQREEARLRGTVGELTASRAQAEGRITETDIEILRLGSGRREEAITQLRDFGYRELELVERRRALAERIDRLDIRAPVSGIVLGMQVTAPRSVLRPADPVLYLIPQDRPLVIASQVPPIHIDQVHPGQAVKLVFSAFSARTTPELNGRVAVVSADALTDQRSQMSYYRAEIVLEPGEIEKLEGLTLIPGMPVEAFIRTEDRSPMTYLIKPFTDYFTRAFRET
ncbi:HlyD family type I secretion periplasmic adaptor subunit [Fertoebacter nigrum]|uniref:Membrane fusion protein (MFP) family protein n=1 Tax=Fertoeibacter niger TaxID=2656921 RepID=A0A8X8H2Q3_9RHOB|nr:HlyD family type I secretion periplasmic adaptor subunit [Fertoeibacter niger]NUB46030.1 HlyD family type I secretion periplasmic adaptor subunit [Fertoeibacter niger]